MSASGSLIEATRLSRITAELALVEKPTLTPTPFHTGRVAMSSHFAGHGTGSLRPH